jgi:hypothetical protein
MLRFFTRVETYSLQSDGSYRREYISPFEALILDFWRHYG